MDTVEIDGEMIPKPFTPIKKVLAEGRRKVAIFTTGAEPVAKMFVRYIEKLGMSSMVCGLGNSVLCHDADHVHFIGYYKDHSVLIEELKAKGISTSIHWIGTDVLWLSEKRFPIPDVDEHYACSRALQIELFEESGIRSHLLPIIPEKAYNFSYLPKGNNVLIYMPSERQEFFNFELMMHVAEDMPDVNFHFYGDF